MIHKLEERLGYIGYRCLTCKKIFYSTEEWDKHVANYKDPIIDTIKERIKKAEMNMSYGDSEAEVEDARMINISMKLGEKIMIPNPKNIKRSNQLLDSCKQIFEDCFELLEKKNNDYAGMDNPYANFESSLLIGVPIEKAILVRMLDKLKRVSNLLDKEAFVTEESIEDTLRDLINYSAILIARREYNLLNKSE